MGKPTSSRDKKGKASKPVGITAPKGKTFHCQHPGCTYRSKSLTNVRKHYAKEGHRLKPKPQAHKLNINRLKREKLISPDVTDEDVALGITIVETIRDRYKMRAFVDELLEDYLNKRRPRGS